MSAAYKYKLDQLEAKTIAETPICKGAEAVGDDVLMTIFAKEMELSLPKNRSYSDGSLTQVTREFWEDTCCTFFARYGRAPIIRHYSEIAKHPVAEPNFNVRFHIKEFFVQKGWIK